MKLFIVRYPRHFSKQVIAATGGEAIAIVRQFAVERGEMPDCAGLLQVEEVL